MDKQRKQNIYNFIAVILLVTIGSVAYAKLANAQEPACLSPRNTYSILCRN